MFEETTEVVAWIVGPEGTPLDWAPWPEVDPCVLWLYDWYWLMKILNKIICWEDIEVYIKF